MLNVNSSFSRVLPAALGIFATTIAGTVNASFVYEYTGTINVAFEAQLDGSVLPVPQLEGTVISGFAEVADQDFQPGANLIMTDLVSWGFNWSVNNSDYNIDISFDNTDFGNFNNAPGAFNLGSNLEVVEWFWNGIDSAGNTLCIGCLGPGNTTHKMKDAYYDVRGIDGTWTLTAIPLPASLPLLASGLAAFAFTGRRRQKKHDR